MSNTVPAALAAFTLTALADVYNNLAEILSFTGVNKFSSKEKGLARIEKILKEVNVYREENEFPLIGIADDGKLFNIEPPKKAEPAKPAKPVAAKAEAKAPAKKSPGRAPNVAPSDVIIVLVAANPKRTTAADRFSQYETGITVADYIERVGDRKQALRDIAWDLRQDWVQVVGPKTAAAKKARAPKAEEATAEAEDAAPVAAAAIPAPVAPVEQPAA